MSSFLHGPVILTALSTLGAGLFHLRKDVPNSNVSPAVLGSRRSKSQHTATKTVSRGAVIDLSVYTEDAQKDFIPSLPGLDYDPGFKQFAGYLTVDEAHGRRIFYWYVESQSNPSDDPVVLWTNGGPGCSGFVGFGTEHGPYFISQNGTLSPNKYSWNKLASILYIEQPSGVGFSYSDTKADYKTGDKQAASDNYELIRQFLERFSERKSNQFYISSESYGGHYMPQLTMEIINRDTAKEINFQGMLVGNPYVDPFSNTVTQINAFYSHGLLAKPLFDQWATSCTLPDSFDTQECQKLEEKMFKELYGKINPYALDYPVCVPEAAKTSRRRLDSETSSQAQKLLNYSTAGGPPFLPTEDHYRPCSEQHLNSYLNRPDVQEALHVSHQVEKWYECSRIVDYNSRDFSSSIIDQYKEVVQAAIDHDLQVFVFSGDDDSVCSTAGTQYWIWDLGWTAPPEKLWQSWEVEKEVAGYATEFDLGASTKGKFTFVTVHGAGHEVPAYRPMEAFEMLRKVLDHEW
ncbi:Carboxypeptidase Y homolog A [Seminavis robusta]|uniref:Carboxypeptidase n=1 Tax=Seminavis robusta TaxID=568900 RepID=A0A9N8H666_9STRA|nr:Carboxypeptidase Y homolog A [Seminavis robusta]|eukprot:Sro37_g023490.1 Carboxypeptidase Y homolog A (518) ;mRNA; r:148965-150961